MKITLTLIRKGDKVKIAAGFDTDTMGCFVIDTDYDTPEKILEQCRQIVGEFGGFCPVLLNTNGVIAGKNCTDIFTSESS